jgi:hypothetical protein
MKSKLGYGDPEPSSPIRAIYFKSMISSVMLAAILANMEDLIVLRVQMKGTEFRHLLQLNYLQI